MILETKQALFRAHVHLLDRRSRNAHDHFKQTINKFCKEWKLTISMKKTKCITFQKQNKANKKSSLFIEGKVVQNVSEFTYLGINIKSNGSFQSILKNLSCKASCAIFALLLVDLS